ncbi:MAG: flagellar protein FlaG [Massilia sp.]
MSIESLNAQRPVNPAGGKEAMVSQTSDRRSVSPTADAASQAAPAAPSAEHLNAALANINKSLANKSELVFSVDPDSDRTIVRVIDQKTHEVIRQIPSQEALDIAKALDSAQGLLIKQTA